MTENLTISKEIYLPSLAAGLTYDIDTYAAFPYTITNVYQIQTSSGTVTAAIKINGTAVTGMSSISVSSTAQNVSATGANTVAVGNQVQIVFSSNSGALNIKLTLAATRIVGPATLTPQGRLTLSSTLPVMTTDAVAQSTIYYLPYIGQILPVYDGTEFIEQLLGSSGISLALDSNSAHTGYQASGSLFDLFAFMNSGTLTLGTGPAWTNSSTRSAAITQVEGLWVNNASITLRYGNVSGNTTSVAANQATYLGTMYATANGQTTMNFAPAAASGGSANVLGLYNGYNRVRTMSVESDSTASWTYSTFTWRTVNSSTGNSISYVDGLQQSFIRACYTVIGDDSATTVAGGCGIALNSTTSPSSVASYTFGEAGNHVFGPTILESAPVLGYNYVQAMELSTGSTTTWTGGNSTAMRLSLEVDL